MGYTAVVTAEVEAIVSYLSAFFPTLMVSGVPSWEGFAVAVLATYFLLYNGIVILHCATSGAGLPLSMAYVWPMVAYVVIMAALTAAAL